MPAFDLAILIFAVFTNILLAFFVYKNNPKSLTNIILGILSIVTSSWLIVIYVSLLPMDLLSNLFWIRLSIFLAVPQAVLFFLLSNTIPEGRLKIKRNILVGVLVWAVLIMAITISPYAFVDIDVVGGRPSPNPGPGIAPFSLTVIFFSFLAVYTLLRKLLASSGLIKEQLRYVTLGILLMLGLIIFTVLIPVIIYKSNTFVPFMPLYTLLFLGMTAYAIIRHRLLDIRIVVARAVAYTLLLVILGAFYSAAIFSLTGYFFDDSDLPITVYVVLALFAAFSFQPLKNVLEKVTTKIFFKNQYDSNDLLFSLTKVMATTLDLSQLTRGTLKELLSAIAVSRGAFLIIGKDALYPSIYIGSDHAPAYDFSRVCQLANLRRLMVFDEEQLESVKEFMREENVSVILPLYVGDENEGILVLGEKKSGEIYSNQDIEVLQIFGPEISVAVQNAKAYEEIRQFNITLTKEIDKATHDLKIANEKLQELDKLKDDFVSVASHELRTPMTAIKSYLWMALNKRKNELSDDMKRYLDRSYISVERLISLVNDMLNISRIEGGRIALNLSEVDLVSLAREVQDEVLAKANEKKVSVAVEEAEVPKVLADRDKIHEVLLNLVGNSLKFTPEGGKITVSFLASSPYVITKVSDTGRGIAKEDLPRLFAKFGRLDNSYVSVAESSGTGLGLYISRSLVTLHKESIEVTSEGIGKGACFTFSLPVATKEVLEHAEQFSLKPKEGEVKALEPVAI